MNQLFKRIIAYMLDQYQTVLTILAVVSHNCLFGAYLRSEGPRRGFGVNQVKR